MESNIAETVDRTLTPGEWEGANRSCPADPEQVPDIVATAMRSLRYSRDSETTGTMWAAVPQVGSMWVASSGAVVISARAQRTSLSPSFICIVPASESDEVQFGFCPVQVGLHGPLRDEILGNPDEHPPRLSPPRIKTGTMTLGRILPELLFSKSQEGVDPKLVERCVRSLLGEFNTINVLATLTDQEREIILSALDRAYPGCRFPTTIDQWKGFHGLYSLCEERHEPFYVFPWYYTITVPGVIFEAIVDNVKRGTPPLVPNYFTAEDHMTNGAAAEPCTGMDFGYLDPNYPHKKLIAGMSQTFNCDLPGRASVWHPKCDPPDEWVESFLRVSHDLGKAITESDDSMTRHDMALHYTRKIPAMCIEESGPVFRRLLSVTKDSAGRVTKVITRSCDPSGTDFTAPRVVLAEENESENRACNQCGEVADGPCPECDSHSCVYCSRWCEECNFMLCLECFEQRHNGSHNQEGGNYGP